MPKDVPLTDSHRVDGRSFLSLVSPEDVTEVVNAFRSCLEDGFAVVRISVVGGRSVDLHYLDMRSTYGVVLRIVIQGQGDEGPGDVPTAVLVESRPRLATVTKDELANITEIDPAATALLGWTSDEIVGRRTLDFIHPDDHARAVDNWMEMITHGARHAVRLRYRARDGAWVWLETSNELRVEEDGRRWVHGQMIDISEEMAATEALHYSEALLRRITETVPVGLAEVGLDGSLRYMNPAMQNLLNEHAAPTVPDMISILDPEDHNRLAEAMSGALVRGRDGDVDIRLPGAGNVPDRMCRIAVKALIDKGQVLGALVCVMDVSDLKAEAATDPLTGLRNRTSIFTCLRHALSRPEPVGVIYVDIDGFKAVNDNAGHAAGDQVLEQVAEALRGAIREGDAVGRVGGDEFVAVCPNVSSPDDLLEVSERLQEAVTDAMECSGLSPTSGASVGVAWAEPGLVGAEELVSRADAAMYVGKRRRSSRPVLWDLTGV